MKQWTGNLGNLMLIVIPAICNEPKSPFGDFSICMADGAAYVSVSMAVTISLSLSLPIFLFLVKLLIVD